MNKKNPSKRISIKFSGFCNTDYLISARRPDLIIINKQKKKRTCRIMDFAVPADYRLKFKENKKRDKF